MAASELPVEHLFTLTAHTGDASHGVVKRGPAGTRLIVPVTGGTFEGPRIKGTIVPPGGDWVSMRAGGIAKLDVRLMLVTDDGESIFMAYQGIGRPGGDGQTIIRTAPTFEAGPGDYAWLNDIQAVGVGEASNDVVRYEIYALS